MCTRTAIMVLIITYWPAWGVTRAPGRRGRAAGGPRVVAIFGVQGWRGAWAREVRELVLALDAAAAGQQQWRALARQAAREARGGAAA